MDKLREAQSGFATEILLSPSPSKERGKGTRWMRNQKGQLLIEALIALAILGVVAVAFLTALTTASRAIIIADERTNAESLARTELEYVKSRDFSVPCPGNPWSYQASSTTSQAPAPGEAPNAPSWWPPNGHTLAPEYIGYSVLVTGMGYDADGDTDPDADIWEITVRVYHSDSPNPDYLLLTTSTYKVKR